MQAIDILGLSRRGGPQTSVQALQKLPFGLSRALTDGGETNVEAIML